jgi:hypothetical protein
VQHRRIAALYEIAERVCGKSAADRLALRQAESQPLVADLHFCKHPAGTALSG